MKKILVLALTLALVFSMFTTANAENAEPIYIGGIYPLTGSVASIGQNIQKGINYAVAEINAAGGINGRPIEMIWGDSQGDPKVGMSEAERLFTTTEICALIGCYQSAVTEVVAQVAEKYQTPMITSISTASVLTTHGYQYFFRMCPTNMSFLKSMLYYTVDLAKQQGVEFKTVGVIADNTLMGQETLKWTKYWSEIIGYEVVAEVLHTTGAADLTSEILTLKKAKPDIVVGDSYAADAILLVNTMAEQNFRPAVMVCKATGYIDPSFLENTGSLANGIATATEWAPDMSKGAGTNAGFKAEYGIDMNGHSAQAYTAMWVLKTAIEQAGSTDKAAIRDVMAELVISKEFPNGPELILPYDEIRFVTEEIEGELHTNNNPNALTTVAQIQDGAYVTVWPFDVTEHAAVYPANYN